MNGHAVITLTAFATSVPSNSGDDETIKTLRNTVIYGLVHARRDMNLTQYDVMMRENGEQVARSGIEVLKRGIDSISRY